MRMCVPAVYIVGFKVSASLFDRSLGGGRVALEKYSLVWLGSGFLQRPVMT